MSHDKDVQISMKNVILKIIEALELDIDQIQYEVTKSFNTFPSVIYYVLLHFKDEAKNHTKEYHLVLKQPIHNFSHINSNYKQFQNEIIFYEMYAEHDENYARCIYVDKRPTDLAIALENVNERGYYSCPYKSDIPLEYTLAAMRQLGRFHGKGYAMKKLQREKFYDIVAQLHEIRYFKKTDNVFEILSNLHSTHAIEYLRDRGYDRNFCDKVEAVFSNAFDNVMMKTVEPLEPLSTICHGDFTTSNLLFRKENDGQYRAMMIDFGLLRYSTPVVDLATFLCLHCSSEMIKNKFFEIIRAYHDALKEYLLETGTWDMEKYSYEILLDDYRKGALFGFVIACFQLPILLGHVEIDVTIENLLRLGVLEGSKRIHHNDEICKILADMLLALKDLGCLKHIL